MSLSDREPEGPPAPPPYSWLLKRALGVPLREAVALSNDPRFLTAIVPSGNVIGTANEASRFFQLLLNEGQLDGHRIFDRRTVHRAVAEQTHLEVDSMLSLPVRYGIEERVPPGWLARFVHPFRRGGT